ncbi:MAG TPA: type II secretion system protein [Phycisphaerae bacterium]|nr:type II secretion system protein [Phycisphaerae bacterium]
MKNRRAFTLVELLMVIGIIALLVTITAPMLGRAIFTARRATCAAQINGALKGMAQYATANDGRFPSCGYGWKTTRFDEIGANITVEDTDPANCTTTHSNSRNLFLALRTRYVDPALMTCPAVRDAEGPNLVDSSNRLLYDFDVNVGGQYVEKCNYSFHLQFASREGGAKGWPLVQTSRTEMAVLADKNPYVTYPGGAVNGGFRAKTIGVGADLNSPNHRYHGVNEGQNVGYIDGHAEWKTSPHVGPSADNIYTVWKVKDEVIDVVDGMIAADSMPAGRTDCFLVP